MPTGEGGKATISLPIEHPGTADVTAGELQQSGKSKPNYCCKKVWNYRGMRRTLAWEGTGDHLCR